MLTDYQKGIVSTIKTAFKHRFHEDIMPSISDERILEFYAKNDENMNDTLGDICEQEYDDMAKERLSRNQVIHGLN